MGTNNQSKAKVGTKEVIPNLSKVAFMNTAGLNRLVLCDAKVNAPGGELTLYNFSGQSQKLLRVAEPENTLNELPDEKLPILYARTLKTLKALNLIQ